jgi:hypothetical protein
VWLKRRANDGSPELHSVEMPAANGLSTARGLAKVAAVLAGKGVVGDTRLFSGETYRLAMAGEVKMYDDILMVRSGTTIAQSHGEVLTHTCHLSRPAGVTSIEYARVGTWVGVDVAVP